MADHDDLETPTLLEKYLTRFGDDADFDRWTMTPVGSEQLMREALQRGTPVTKADMHRVHKELFDEDFPDYADGLVL